MSGTPIAGDYIKAESKASRMGVRLMAIVAEGDRGRVYLSPTQVHEMTAHTTKSERKPESELVGKCRDQLLLYGMSTFAELFTPRQLVALMTFSDLVAEARAEIERDALAAGSSEDTRPPLRDGSAGATAEAVGAFLGLAVGRSANYWSSLTPWGGDFIVQTFGRQAIPMVWDYAEGNPLSSSTGNWTGALEWIEEVISRALPALQEGQAIQC